MSKFSFSLDLKRILLTAGWSEDRQVNLSTVIQSLHSGGVSLSGFAISTLEQFEGLCIDPVCRVGTLFRPESILFVPTDAVDGEQDRLLCWGEGLGESVSPLGSYGSNSILFTVASGGTFVGLDSSVWPVADQFELALHHLVFADQKPKWWKPIDYRQYCRQRMLPLGSP